MYNGDTVLTEIYLYRDTLLLELQTYTYSNYNSIFSIHLLFYCAMYLQANNKISGCKTSMDEFNIVTTAYHLS